MRVDTFFTRQSLIEMKQESNKEIDLLLRRLGRRPEASVSDPDGGHLDADELSSYAENALPPSARARYTEHLAQCSSCRTIVVQLSSAAGVVVAPPSVVSEPSGLRKFLASLFSPLVLRYAIPALGLAVIAVIGLTVFRTAPPSDLEVARRTSAPAPPPQQAQTPTAGSEYNDKLESAKSAPAATPESGSINFSKDPPPAAPTVAGKTAAPVADTTNAPANAAAPPAKPEVQPVIASTPASSPASVATGVDERKVQAKKQEVQRQIDAARAPQREGAYAQARDEDYRRAQEARPPATSESAQTAGAGAKVKSDTGRSRSGVATLQSDRSAEKEADDAEIRTVAGRRFRKQRGVWVDTAYNASTEAMTLTRGSERFRALVADEPEIKNIADQLEGEIVVVWKGRAYRIR